MEIKRIETLLGLQWPYEILRIGMYKDGGSIGGAVGDAKSQQLLFSWDGGMRLRPEDVARMGTRHGWKARRQPALEVVAAPAPRVSRSRRRKPALLQA